MTWDDWPIDNPQLLARYVIRHERLHILENLVRWREERKFREIANSIYDALCKLEINYEITPINDNPRQQSIRKPELILEGPKVGTCLDLACLFAGECLARGLFAVVVSVVGHAYVLVSFGNGLGDVRIRGRASFNNGILQDRNDFLKLIDQYEFFPIECTGFARANNHPEGKHLGISRNADLHLTFNDALAVGLANSRNREFRFAIDVAELHIMDAYKPFRGETTLDPENLLPKLPDDIRFPQDPYRDLERFRREDARVFFGRNREIWDLYEHITREDSNARKIMLVYGQTGVGKSSVLEAGLLPRLENSHKVIYLQRDATLKLLGTVVKALESLTKTNGMALKELWEIAEHQNNLPVVIILDQIDEAFPIGVTAGNNAQEGNKELDELINSLSTIFRGNQQQPRGKIVLGFRKEVLAEIENTLKTKKLVYNWLYLNAIERSGIIEAIARPARHEDFQLRIEPRLAEVIADDLLADLESPIGPTLQILMNQLWSGAEPNQTGHKEITLEQYNTLRRPGELFKQFFKDKIKAIECWKPELKKSGLLLDLLEFHTTALGTTEQREQEEVIAAYQHHDRADILEILDQAKQKRLLVDAAKLNKLKATRLAHDTLAPLVQKEFKDSPKLGQRAYRLLAPKAEAWVNKNQENHLDERDLGVVEQGSSGMRFPKAIEGAEQLIEFSKVIRAKNQRQRQWFRGLGTFAIVLIVLSSIFAWRQYNIAQASLTRELAGRLSAQALTQLDNRPDLALLLSLKATQLFDSYENKDALVSTLQNLDQNLFAILRGGSAKLVGLKFSNQKNILITVDSLGNIYYWDILTKKIIKKIKIDSRIKLDKIQIESVVFSKDLRRFLLLKSDLINPSSSECHFCFNEGLIINTDTGIIISDTTKVDNYGEEFTSYSINLDKELAIKRFGDKRFLIYKDYTKKEYFSVEEAAFKTESIEFSFLPLNSNYESIMIAHENPFFSATNKRIFYVNYKNKLTIKEIKNLTYPFDTEKFREKYYFTDYSINENIEFPSKIYSINEDFSQFVINETSPKAENDFSENEIINPYFNYSYKSKDNYKKLDLAIRNEVFDVYAKSSSVIVSKIIKTRLYSTFFPQFGFSCDSKKDWCVSTGSFSRNDAGITLFKTIEKQQFKTQYYTTDKWYYSYPRFSKKEDLMLVLNNNLELVFLSLENFKEIKTLTSKVLKFDTYRPSENDSMIEWDFFQGDSDDIYLIKLNQFFKEQESNSENSRLIMESIKTEKIGYYTDSSNSNCEIRTNSNPINYFFDNRNEMFFVVFESYITAVNLNSCQMKKVFEIKESKISLIDFSKSFNKAFIVTDNSTLIEYDFTKREQKDKKIVDSSYKSIKLSSTEKIIAIGDSSEKLYLYNTQDLVEYYSINAGFEKTPFGNSNEILDIDFDISDKNLVFGTGNGKVYVWNLEFKDQLGKTIVLDSSRVDFVRIASSGIITVSQPQFGISFIDFSSDFLKTKVCAIVNRDFTEFEWREFFGSQKKEPICSQK